VSCKAVAFGDRFIFLRGCLKRWKTYISRYQKEKFVFIKYWQTVYYEFLSLDSFEYRFEDL